LNPKKAKLDDSILVDSRFPRLNAASMTLGDWRPYPIAPPAALIRQHGDRGLKDAQLTTNHAPSTESFYNGVWEKVIRELTERYPKRFEEVWIYLGPIYGPNSSNLSSGIAVPDGYYAIAFDLTNEGGLRALALNIPVDGVSKNLNDYITSIEKIEKLTGLQFLPGLDYSLRDTIGSYVSPSVW
jgi:endonuclease G